MVRVAPGIDLPYPEPTSDAASRIGRANRRVDSKVEVALRSELHWRGLRFRKDYLVRSGGARARVDICFTRVKVAVFVDGCFWHMCPTHCHVPKSNVGYWLPKLEANVARDRRVDAAFSGDGWVVLHVWEHEPVIDAAERVIEALAAAGDEG